MIRGSALIGLFLGVGVVLSAGCDRKWDFECSAAWTKGGVQVWKKVYTYPEMDSETAATAKCKEAMLEARPRGANAATCKCVGKE